MIPSGAWELSPVNNVSVAGLERDDHYVPCPIILVMEVTARL